MRSSWGGVWTAPGGASATAPNSNTVGRCIGVRDAAPAGCHPLVYHSRFRYEDRVARHGDVIGAFRGTGAALVTTTQVAEMSLDLSADLLVTDLAPIPALIQRLGRLNRRSHPDAPRPVAPFLIVEPASHSPYEEDELDAARAWLEKLGDAPLSQRRLIDAWPSADEAPQRLVRSAWLDGGFHTEAEPLRGAMPGITVVREEDLPHPAVTSSLAARLAIPMNTPRRDAAWKAWRRAAGIYPVAPAGTIDYDAQRGAQWRAAV